MPFFQNNSQGSATLPLVPCVDGQGQYFWLAYGGPEGDIATETRIARIWFSEPGGMEAKPLNQLNLRTDWEFPTGVLVSNAGNVFTVAVPTDGFQLFLFANMNPPTPCTVHMEFAGAVASDTFYSMEPMN